MKLRYIANCRLPTEKAHGLQIMTMCAAFANAGVEVELVVPERYNTIAEDPFTYYNISRAFTIRYLPTIDLTRWERLLGSWVFLLQRWSFSRAAFRDALAHPADVYYLREEWTFKRFAQKRLPSVWEVHDLPTRLARYRVACKRSIGLVAITHGLAERLSSLLSQSRIFVAPDGVDLATFAHLPSREEARRKLRWDDTKIFALYTGHLYPWKGVDTLVEASRDLPSDVRVKIVGGGARLEELRSRAQTIGSSCDFVGQVKHDEVPTYLAAADMVVIPNSGKEEISRLFTSPLKLFEALAAGKAIIASDLPSLREVLDSFVAILVPSDNPEALRNAIIELANDPERRRIMGIAASERGSCFSWDARADCILDFIRKRLKATT